MLDSLYEADQHFLKRKVQPWVWWYEYHWCRTRFSLGRILLGIATVSLLMTYARDEEIGLSVMVIGVALWWCFDTRLARREEIALAEGPRPNPWRTHSKWRLLNAGLLLLLLMSGVHAPPVTLGSVFGQIACTFSLIAFVYVLSSDPLPFDYEPARKNRPRG